MKRTFLPVVILMAISLTMGTVIGASSKAKDPIIVITNQSAEKAADVSETLQFKASATPVVQTIQLTPDNSGNWRHPGIAEDSRGNRLVIYRGAEGTKYWYSYCPKGGTWSAPQSIGNNQPTLIGSLYSYIEIDSSDRFHCEWENANAAVYASFKDGVWTTPIKITPTGRYDQTSGLTVSSTDQVITVDCEVIGFNKDIYLHRKGKNDAAFAAPFNLTRDKEGSTQPCVAVDSQDNVWVVWKSDYNVVGDQDNLVIFLAQFLPNNFDGPIEWIVASPDPGWSFLPQVAVNSEDKVMTEYACSTTGQHMSRLYDPATKTLGPIVSLNIGICRIPWHTFFSRLVAHGKDFYAIAMNGTRTINLVKFNEAANRWDLVAPVSTRGAEQFAMYSGYDQLLIAWNSIEEPTNVYLTTVDVDPFSKVKIKSVSNLTWKKTVERTFFHAYYLNTLAWETNPENTQKAIVITAHRIYRKTRAEDDTKWTRITEVAGTVFNYIDRNIPANSDYVYAVTCVDDREHESKIF
jgi:hypothetical protein